MTDAETCRSRGWGVGTRLIGSEAGWNGGPDTSNVIVITAIGDRSILARCVEHNGAPHPCREQNWTLALRDWKEVKA